MLPLGLGVAAGVDGACGAKTLIGIGKNGGVRHRSAAVLTLRMVNSNGVGLLLLYCSTRVTHAVVS